MKPASGGWISHLAGNPQRWAMCWQIERTDGTFIRLTDCQIPLTVATDARVNGTYLSTSGITRTAIKSSADLQVDAMDVEGLLDAGPINATDIRAGRYDMAEVFIFVVIWDDLASGVIIVRRGFIANVTVRGKKFMAEVVGMTYLLGREILQLVTPNCRAVFGDSQCTITPATQASTVNSIPVASKEKYRFVTSGFPNPAPFADRWDQGVITWTSGPNVGLKMELKTFTFATQTWELASPMPFAIAAGHGFTAAEGCNRKFATCRDRFSNILNFRAESKVPLTTQMLKYPDVTDSGYLP